MFYTYNCIVSHCYFIGQTILVPFYEDEMEEETDVSSEDEDLAEPRWCTVRRNTHINGYGDAAAYIGMEFSRSNAEEGELSSGVIDAVVKKTNCVNGAMHFKLVNHSRIFNFVPCKNLMSTSKSNVFKVCNVFNLYFDSSNVLKVLIYFSVTSASEREAPRRKTSKSGKEDKNNMDIRRRKWPRSWSKLS